MIRSCEATVAHRLKSRPGDENLTIVLDAANVARLRVVGDESGATNKISAFLSSFIVVMA